MICLGRDISDEDSAEQEQDDLEMLAADTGMGEAVGEDDDGDGPIDKNSHRAIPAWEDAIGVIIAVNMESRARIPRQAHRAAEVAAGAVARKPEAPLKSLAHASATIPSSMHNLLLGSLARLRSVARHGFVGRAGPGGTKRYRIAVIPKGTTHVFWKSVHAGALKAAKRELGNVEIQWKGALLENDREGQINVVQDFVAQGVDGIVLAPLGFDGAGALGRSTPGRPAFPP